MVDIEKQIAFWRSSAEEDWDVARQLVENERTRHGLFFAHLAHKKFLRRSFYKHSRIWRQLPISGFPIGGLPSIQRRWSSGLMNAFHIEGRYPESLSELRQGGLNLSG